MKNAEKTIFPYKISRIDMMFALFFYSVMILIFIFSDKGYWELVARHGFVILYLIFFAIDYLYRKKPTTLIIDKAGITQTHRWVKSRNWHYDYSNIEDILVDSRKLHKMLRIKTIQGEQFDIQYSDFKSDFEPKTSNVRDLAIMKAISQYYKIDFLTKDDAYKKQGALLNMDLNLGRHVEILAYSAIPATLIIIFLAFTTTKWYQLGVGVNLNVGIIFATITVILISVYLITKKARFEAILFICVLYLFIGGFAGTLLVNIGLGVLGTEHSVEYELVSVGNNKLTWESIDKPYPAITYYTRNSLQTQIYAVRDRHIFRIKGGLLGLYVIDDEQLGKIRRGLSLDS